MKEKITFFFILTLHFSLFSQNERDTLLQLPYSECYIETKVTERTILDELGNRFSIDNVTYLPDEQCFRVIIWLHQRDFENFLALRLPFEIRQPKPNDAKVTMATTLSMLLNNEALYPTYSVYEELMNYFQTTYPSICKIDTILAATPDGHKILAAHISSTLHNPTPKPKFFYTSTMHGDENGSYYLMLRLINYILENQTDSRVSKILNSIDLRICPLENPDGTYYMSDDILGGTPISTRANATGYDLNRSYPKAFTAIGTNYPPEVKAMMDFMTKHQFTMSANLHGGVELFNYVWDCYTTSQKKHPDAHWWSKIGRAFADTCHLYNSNYFTDQDNGVTSGGNWYVIINSRQDYANYHARCREVTLEVTGEKTPHNDRLNSYWNSIKASLLNYILSINQGVNGIITDSLTGESLKAHVIVNNYDDEAQHSDIYSQLPFGDYYRPLLPGTYSITYSAQGYYSQTHTVQVTQNAITVKNVRLYKPLNCKDIDCAIDPKLYPNPTNNLLKIVLPNTYWIGSTITFFSITGQQIDSFVISDIECQIDVGTYADGIYLARFSNHEKELFKKIVVHK